MASAIDLAAVGDNCIDRLHGHVNATLVGGNALNVAVQVARSGLCASYFGAVGPIGESTGDLVEAELRKNSVDSSYLTRRDLSTSVTDINVLPNGDRQIRDEDFGACAGYRPDKDAFTRLLEARHVHLGWLDDGSLLHRQLVLANRSVSRDLSINAAPEDLEVSGLSLAFCALPEQRANEAGSLARELVGRGAGIAVVTLGAQGSLVFADGTITRADALPVNVTDTTGAGDSYIAGFLVATLKGANLLESMNAGHKLAAKTCQHLGGFPQNNIENCHEV